MKVILLDKVPNVGNVGEMVNVSQGHARNYLLPKQLAVIADEGNQKDLKQFNKRFCSIIKSYISYDLINSLYVVV